MNELIHCPKCDQTKSPGEFNKGAKKHGTQTYCRECQKEYEKTYWHSRKDRHPKWHKKKQERKWNYTRFLIEYLLKNPCVDCGESDPLVLQFDHIRGEKKFNISEAVGESFSLERIKAEIEKCEIRCANCHTIKTAYENGYWLLDYLE